MRKKFIFAMAAIVLAGLAAWGVWAVGSRSEFFGIDRLKQEAEKGTALTGGYRYGYRWDPEEDAVYGMDVEWVNGTVEIRPTSARLIRITERSDGRDLTDSEKLKMSYSGGMLKISWDKKLLDLAILENTRKDLTVEIPRSVLEEGFELIQCRSTSGEIRLGEGLSAEKLVLSSSSGRIQVVDGFQAETADVSTTSGEVQLRNLNVAGELKARSTGGALSVSGVICESAELKNTLGETVFEGSARELALETVSGAARADFWEAPESAELSSVSAPITVRLSKETGFTVGYDTVSGKFDSELPLNATAKDRQYTYGDGKAKLSFTTTGGSMILAPLGQRQED